MSNSIVECDDFGLKILDRQFYGTLARPLNGVSQFKNKSKVKCGILRGKDRPHPVMGVGKIGIDERGVYNEYWEIIEKYSQRSQRQQHIEKIKNGMFCVGGYELGGFLPPNYEKIVKDITTPNQRRSGMEVYGFSYKGHNIRHRSDGPAVIYHNSSTMEFIINGYDLTLTNEYAYCGGLDEEMQVYYLLKYGQYLPKKITS